MERDAPQPIEVVLPDGSVAEVEATTEFTSRVDRTEDRVNDGNRYKGLLSKADYDKRKRTFADKLRSEADPEGYRREKLEAGRRASGRRWFARAAQPPRRRARRSSSQSANVCVKNASI